MKPKVVLFQKRIKKLWIGIVLTEQFFATVNIRVLCYIIIKPRIWDFFYRRTDRPTDKGRHRSSSPELKNSASEEKPSVSVSKIDISEWAFEYPFEISLLAHSKPWVCFAKLSSSLSSAKLQLCWAEISIFKLRGGASMPTFVGLSVRLSVCRKNFQNRGLMII